MAAVSFLRLACVTDPTRLGLGLVSGCIHSTPTLCALVSSYGGYNAERQYSLTTYQV